MPEADPHRTVFHFHAGRLPLDRCSNLPRPDSQNFTVAWSKAGSAFMRHNHCQRLVSARRYICSQIPGIVSSSDGLTNSPLTPCNPQLLCRTPIKDHQLDILGGQHLGSINHGQDIFAKKEILIVVSSENWQHHEC
jgi:hypothetical protein